MKLSDIREEYSKKALEIDQVEESPIDQFQVWMNEALQAEVKEPTAMTLSTVSIANKPSSRIVLLKGVEDDAFVFFTNYESNKGYAIANNPNVCLSFFWPDLERQVIIQGKASKVSDHASDTYFNSRPRASRIGAHVSKQSDIIADRSILDKRYEDLVAEYEGREIPRPAHWGGYAVVPDHMEFWQGRPSRLHDRLSYRIENGLWVIERLSP